MKFEKISPSYASIPCMELKVIHCFGNTANRIASYNTATYFEASQDKD